MLKHIIISIVIGLITYIALGLIDSSLQLPDSGPAIARLVILIVAIFVTTQLNRTHTPSEPGNVEAGTVKWFNVKKGYGFITRDQGDDVFVHYRNIEGEGRRSIAEGQRVSFTVIPGDKGLQADQVNAIQT